MLPRPDYSLLDRPEIREFAFYPRREWTPAPPGATDFQVDVEAGVSISCRFYPASPASPCLLFFHGNGEVACDYDGIAPLYNEMDISLFVADYRGYGRSGGQPSFAAMVADAHPIFRFFRQSLALMGYNGPIFLMGRSMGAHSVVELASHYSPEIKGLIVESGSSRLARLLSFLGLSIGPEQAKRLESAILARIRSIEVPVLILHGEWDTLIPPGEAALFLETVSSPVKRLVLIPGAGHNDIMLVGMAQYFSAIREFVFAARGPSEKG